MNPPPSLPFPRNPNPIFAYHPTPQNPNPNFSFQPPPQNPNQYSVAPPPPPVRELPGALASLKSLVSLCERTLDSFSQTLASDSLSLLRKDEHVGFVRCPFNPNHLMPPEDLFLHSLRCPPPLDLTHHLGSPSNYRNTVEPPYELPLNRSGDDLCIYLDDFADFSSSFFYKDCPGVVNLSELDGRRRALTLPSVLFVECCDFVGSTETDKKGMLGKQFVLLPSDLWAIRNEIDAWRDYPRSYSFGVLSAILGLEIVGKSNVKMWILANSPRYGVIIDTYTRDHMFMLLKLCLKAIVKEARGLAEFDANADDENGNEHAVSLKSRRFECAILVQVVTWLASQLAVLYGEGNARFLALDMFRQCVIESASQITMFQSEGNITVHPKHECSGVQEDSESVDANNSSEDVKAEESFESSSGGKGKSSADAQAISVSRVVAAAAALHERSLLEGKIRAIRFTQPPTRYQRMMEHDAMTSKADEERKKRPGYRPVIEHDGLPRQRSSNYEFNKMKTKEELMAEERDYKRRRMTYRGKKVKRTPLQVLRDIIEEYTEEIRLAGGIGCFEKGPEEGMVLPSPSSTGNGRKESDFDYSSASKSSDPSLRFSKKTRVGNEADSDYSTDYRMSTDKEKPYKEYDSGSSRRQQSHGGYRSYDHVDHRILRDTHRYRSRRSPSRPKGPSDYKRQKTVPYDCRSSRRAEEQNGFEDRYNPSE
ncbi:PREDICTED: U11/U12 small nuclear ribonucleoprotein 48 kDa protein [Tarenaya hassleriana]|uniref:U11/U12 small nuclear ribonucleoprotein 48 kDa protein n=1 Tax=Tarenaya hassleriana TaxID=28532 RepID=UPI00053C6C05|nr:PREDICTED: U11/U12 small nuclear ribonucleoprotein 48 kDa protein [Tarenaya hassleriana]XP_010549626.1 PREDICTED: U11/U12 small nuclear ribonucleoprotein 48 kDa protein [Tarenaya hassleriana]XP_010549627.1 PREDICTED: U11/U12 small nuclear ribonucleoprotein 48 kDa protein [Tarenaya hassleriana]XP_010549628.1 PREDICTED: U11/U12 small nuclear ribonucleoprotein 48 kDa protein [Tarenaya hassleriana]